MSFTVIAVVANARHGKDTIANILLASSTKNYYRVALADAMKLDCEELYGDQFPEFCLSFDEKGHISYPNAPGSQVRLAFRRRTWQVWGTEGRRAIFPDIWLWRWADRAMGIVSEGYDGIVVPDVRFHNEAVHFKNRGATLIGTVRMTDNHPHRELEIDYNHPSEREIPQILDTLVDFVIANDGSLEEFRTQVLTTLKSKGLI